MKLSLLFITLLLLSTNSYASILRIDLAGTVDLYSNPNNMGAWLLIEENVPYSASFIIETNTMLAQGSNYGFYNFDFSPYGAKASIGNAIGNKINVISEDELSIQIENDQAIRRPSLFDFIPGYQFNTPHDRIEIGSENDSVVLLFSVVADTNAFDTTDVIPDRFPLSQNDLNIFAYRDFDNDVDAVGLASSFNVTVIPLPPGFYLFGAGLLMLYSRFNKSCK